ncbi:eukaryotic translation initiation factor 3 subunit G [Panicum miliaceum]|uniref:Eukaryotic translation initiation factor 3 subunit G n=1 Tax=Panicum miliaceum TaxID=4540 RepID=A0A3L6RSS5_PANMI|nr:eukaryotic translation initiation factor 3 subunit G [Panicum miliaceum]
MAAAAAARPQEIPLWARVDICKEGCSDPECFLPRSIGIGDDNLSKATRAVSKLPPPRLSGTIERRSWSKFGEAMEEDASSQVTKSSDEEILLERPRILGSKVDETAVFCDPLDMLASNGEAALMVCRTCGEKGDHWTFRCHFNNIEAKTKRCSPFNEPPICEVCMEPINDLIRDWEEEGHDATIRVTNLSMDICERNLVNLLYRFGLLVDVSLAVDEDSDSSRQFAIVQYGQSEEAEEAISWLDGHKYLGHILRVELAIPRPKRTDVPPLCPSCMQATENCVRVTNLPEDTGECDLYDLFASFGSVNRGRLVADRKSGSRRQVGIVEFVNREDAEWSVEFLNGFQVLWM